MKLIGNGKSKDIHMADDGDIIFDFTDLKILPVEVIWRNYVAGSLWRRFEKGDIKLPAFTEAREGALIPGGMIEFTTKFEAQGRPVNTKEILDSGWMTGKELEYISRITEKINDIMFDCLLRKDMRFLNELQKINN
ncbi:MAG: hypothetical protein FIB08_09660 [Candidatus Methanoperedens sp.]|nr:hypothetical protein [Candidatus Methanoperedens sp.]